MRAEREGGLLLYGQVFATLKGADVADVPQAWWCMPTYIQVMSA